MRTNRRNTQESNRGRSSQELPPLGRPAEHSASRFPTRGVAPRRSGLLPARYRAGALDLSALNRHYAGELRGQPPFDVTLMVTLLVYAYSVGVCSSRKIAAACERNLAFRAIVGDSPPDFRTVSDFRKIHQAAFRPLFLDVLCLAGEMGMVKLGNLSTDGTKMGANASRHKAMSYGYMNKDIARLEAEIDQLLTQAEQIDAEQDAALGTRRGDELPAELKRREDRLVKIREAKARLEAEARVKADEEQRRRDDEQT